MAYAGDIPFDSEGNQLSYAGPGGRRVHHFEPNHEFCCKLRFDGFERGRSAAHAIWRDAAGHRYSMFLTDLDELLRLPASDERAMIGGVCEGRWTFAKRGTNYGVKLA